MDKLPQSNLTQTVKEGLLNLVDCTEIFQEFITKFMELDAVQDYLNACGVEEIALIHPLTLKDMRGQIGLLNTCD